MKEITNKQIESKAILGRELRISPKSIISINKPDYRTHYYTETIELLIGVGKDHTAKLIMDSEAWKALVNGEDISVEKDSNIKRKYFYEIK